MATVTIQIPNTQMVWFEQMLRSMGWDYRNENVPLTGRLKGHVFEADTDETHDLSIDVGVREGWSEAARKAHKQGADQLIAADIFEDDKVEDWQW